METANQKRRVAEPAAETAALVIFGLDDQKKPHASAFVSSQSDLAQKAAALMGMKLFHPKSEEEHALAVQLPRGRIFGSGRAFVPFVASANYKRLCEFAQVTATSIPEPQENQCPASPSPDAAVATAADVVPGEAPSSDQHVKLAVGGLVLACEGNDQAFWEARIVKIDRNVLTLVWEFWPAHAKFKRRITQVSMMPQERPFW